MNRNDITATAEQVEGLREDLETTIQEVLRIEASVFGSCVDVSDDGEYELEAGVELTGLAEGLRERSDVDEVWVSDLNIALENGGDRP